MKIPPPTSGRMLAPDSRADERGVAVHGECAAGLTGRVRLSVAKLDRFSVPAPFQLDRPVLGPRGVDRGHALPGMGDRDQVAEPGVDVEVAVLGLARSDAELAGEVVRLAAGEHDPVVARLGVRRDHRLAQRAVTAGARSGSVIAPLVDLEHVGAGRGRHGQQRSRCERDDRDLQARACERRYSCQERSHPTRARPGDPRAGESVLGERDPADAGGSALFLALRGDPNDVRRQAHPLHRRDHGGGDVHLPPAQTVAGRPRERVVVVVPGLAEREDREPEDVAGLVRRRRTGACP